MVEGNNSRNISSDFDVRQSDINSSVLTVSTPASIKSDDEKNCTAPIQVIFGFSE